MRNGRQPILALLLGGMLWATAAQADERREFNDLYREWIEAIVGERDDAAEALQQKIHDIARETGARMQEMLQPQVELVEQRIAELREQGRLEVAERLAERQREVFQAHQQAQAAQQEAERAEESRSAPGSDAPARQRQVQDLERRIDKLRQQGDFEQAERVARELVRLRERRAPQAKRPALERDRELRDGGRPGFLGPAPQQRNEMQRRMQHLRGAADNLHAIGMHDLAERLQREADELQQALKPPQPPGEGPPPRMLNEIQERLRGLDKQLDEINRRLDELLELARQQSR
ncbi:MAG: hypothetical protein GXY58_16315 [Planctomycetaceae bacterium]|nr:hypothetical protein [Planctomycetaceae bacterium]